MDHSDVSNWSDRAEALLSEGKETEAEALLQTVIRAIESKGDNNLGLAAALNDLGLLYCRQGLTLKADPLLQRALAIRHRVEETPVQKSNEGVVQQLDALSITENGVRNDQGRAESPQSEGESADWETRDWDEDDAAPVANAQKTRKSGGWGSEDFDEVEQNPKPSTSSGSKPRGRGAVRFGGGSLYSDRTSEERDTWEEENSRPPSRSCRADEADTWLRSETPNRSENPNIRNFPGEAESRADDLDDWAADRAPLASTSGMDHVLEVYGFAPSVKTMDLESLFWAYRDEGLAIRWVDDTHAVAVFRRPSVARAALASIQDTKFKLRPFAEASLSTLRLPPEDLRPPVPRPKTTARAARRLIAGALNDKDVKRAVKAMSNSADERRQEAERKAKRNLTHQLKAEAWGDGYH